MDMDRGTFEEQVLAHEERQTKALESLSTYFMRFLAVLSAAVLVLVIALLVNS